MATVQASRRYAARTEVDPTKTRAEIEQLLARYHATSFAYYTRDEDNYAAIEFELGGQTYRLHVRYPSRKDHEITHDSRGYRRTELQAERAREQVIRQRWRALRLFVHATLEAVTAGITTLQEALFAHLLLPDRRSMYEFMQDSVGVIAETGAPPALPAPRD
jgi:hypothetical protein